MHPRFSPGTLMGRASGTSDRARGDDDDARSTGAAESLRPPTESGTSKLVLVVDDEAPLAEAIAFIVEDAGYEVITARHGREALEFARKQRPALVITDLMMPHMDGKALIAALHDGAIHDGRGAPPVVLMTAGGLRQAEEAGADALLRKPFEISAIEDLLYRFLGDPDR